MVATRRSSRLSEINATHSPSSKRKKGLDTPRQPSETPTATTSEDDEDEQPQLEDTSTAESPTAEADKEVLDRYMWDSASTANWLRQETINRFRYLLGLNELFKKFIETQAESDPSIREALQEAERGRRKSTSQPSKSNVHRHNCAQNEESLDEGLLEDGGNEIVSVFSESPPFVEGKLRDYQIDGLNWLISLYQNSISGILADEMGLGKTFQTISFLSYLGSVVGIPGPHLVLVPKSTMANWKREFQTWAPKINVVLLSGDKYQRAETIGDELLTCNFDVCITSYELLMKEKTVMKKFAWQYLIVDEAHRIKNKDSMLSKIVRMLFSHYRLLITGTPLQNNLEELWALLNFLLPDVFSDVEVFQNWFQGEDNTQDQDQVIEQLHKLLHPFLLRRVKADVEKTLLPKREINLYVRMVEMQKVWYRNLLMRDLDAVNGTGSQRNGKTRLLNIVMQLRKCCDHPYLFEGAEPGPPFTTDEHIVTNSGKFALLDRLLSSLKAQGSRVLIFSQMSRMLDILEDYCGLRGYKYCRIDGSTMHEDRIEAIDNFNAPDSDRFIFLLTTRAGGLGINLTTADQVIIYDSDWNPQADLQAMDRAHRIGQKKQVTVYRLVTIDTIEEKVLERAAQKLRLDQLVIQQGRSKDLDALKASTQASKDDLMNMIRHGAAQVFDESSQETGNQSLEDIIKQGEQRTKELNSRFSDLGLDELKKFTFDHPTPIVVKAASKEQETQRSRRDRRYTYMGEDDRGRQVHRLAQEKFQDFQFIDSEAQMLLQQENMYSMKTSGTRYLPGDFSDDENEIDNRNQEIDNAEPLTAEQKTRLRTLLGEGFPSFTRRDLAHFMTLVVKHGKDEIDSICEVWPERADEIRRYHQVFFKRWTELEEYPRFKEQILVAEERRSKMMHQYEILKNKINSCQAPLSELKIPYLMCNSRRTYTEDEDRFLLHELYDIGLTSPNLYEKIRDRIRSCGLFNFDWFFQSRSPAELSRRCSTLLLLITREVDGPNAMKRKARNNSEPDSPAATPPPRKSSRVRQQKAVEA